MQNAGIGEIIDMAFVIYKEKFTKQFSITVIINLIYMSTVTAILWIGYKIIPATPPKITDIIIGNLKHITIFSIILLISLMFKFIVTSANIIVAGYEQSLLKSLFKIVKSVPALLLALFAELIVCIPVLIASGYIVYKFKLTLVPILFSVIIILILNSFFALSVAVYQIDSIGFIKSIKPSFAFVKNKKSLSRFFRINILWSMIYWGFFILVTLIVGFIFPTPAFFAKIPYSQYLVPIYRVWIAYLLTMFATPIGKNILYLLCAAPQQNATKISGFGSKLFAVAIDSYIQLATLSAIFGITFAFLSRISGSSVFTMDLPLTVWLVILAMLIGIMVIYRACFKFILKRPTLGEKIMGIVF